MRKELWFWLVPILFLLAITPWANQMDLQTARYFFQKGDPGHFRDNPWLDFVFDRGVLPAQVVGVSAAFIYLTSLLTGRWKNYRSTALALILPLVIGAGAIVHPLLKDTWGRPRPRQVVEFGGELPYRPYYSPNFFSPIPAKSFPCGHCSMGFYFFIVFLLGIRRKSPLLIYGGLFLTLFLGLVLSYTRMAQGGHFLTDTIVTAIIMWLTAVATDRWVFGPLPSRIEKSERS